MSGKGGVGKSSIASMVGKILSEKAKTIILDFDVCGPSIKTSFGVNDSVIKTKDGFEPVKVEDTLYFLSFGSILGPDDAVIWRGAKKEMFLELFMNSCDRFEYIVIDTPPGISEEHAFLVGKDVESIIVTTPQNMSLNDAQRCIEFNMKNGIKIHGLIENMSYVKCGGCGVIHEPFGSNGGDLLAAEYNLKLLCKLEIDSSWALVLDNGKFNENYKNTSAYEKLKKVLEDLGI